MEIAVANKNLACHEVLSLNNTVVEPLNYSSSFENETEKTSFLFANCVKELQKVSNNEDVFNEKIRQNGFLKSVTSIQRINDETVGSGSSSSHMSSKHKERLQFDETVELVGDDLSVEKLKSQLCAVSLALVEKDKKCNTLITLQSKVDGEVQELTAALFQEAYRMVNSAEERAQNAERLLSEARLKVDMLENEVQGLKKIVINANINNSTPTRRFSASKSTIMMRFLKNSLNVKSIDLTLPNQTISPNKISFFSFTPKSASQKQVAASNTGIGNGNTFLTTPKTPPLINNNIDEIDPICYKEFTIWRDKGLSLNEEYAFFKRILLEDIDPCLLFENKELSIQILSAVKANTLEIEPFIHAENKNSSAVNVRKCSLLKIKRACPYRLRISSTSEWQFISLLARNRIASVCDFFTYIRYLHEGIVNPGINDSYNCVMILRKNMTLAKLGLHFALKMNANFSTNSSASTPLE